jgi:hypothetical protein
MRFVLRSFVRYVLFDDLGETEHCIYTYVTSVSVSIGTKQLCSECDHFELRLRRLFAA